MRRKNLKEKGITLVALVVTIIILLILAGVVIGTVMSGNGLFESAKKSADVTNYQSAKESVLLKLWGIRLDCETDDSKNYDVNEIEAQLFNDDNFIIVGYYPKTARIKDGVTRNKTNLNSIGITVKGKEEYNFEVSNEGEIVGATFVEDTTTTINESDFVPIETFEKEKFGITSTTPSKTDNSSESSQNSNNTTNDKGKIDYQIQY